MYCSVDSMESGTARLVQDDGTCLFVPAEELPQGTVQGDILYREDEKWITAPEETQRRKAHAQEMLKKILGREQHISG